MEYKINIRLFLSRYTIKFPIVGGYETFRRTRATVREKISVS
jgi:hypothetical protein